MLHFSGDKISANHSTAIESAVPALEFLQAQKAVKKIMLGYIDNHASSSGADRLKIIKEDTAILLSVTGGGANQEVRVYTKPGVDIEYICAQIERALADTYNISTLDRR